MTSKGKKKSATIYVAAAVILTCYLAQQVDCHRLKKTVRREGRKDADAVKRIGVQEGEIVFGRVFEKGSGLASQAIDGIKKSSSNASVGDEAAYQADFAGWLKGQTQDAGSREASWKHMASSLQCGEDQLKFRAVGPGASQFALEQGNAPPLPLSQVPSTCGYSMQRNSLALVMLVPYNGCNVVQEGGNYVLPMRWQGVPVSLWCPKTAPSTTTTTTNPEIPVFPQYPPFYPYPYFPPPTTTATTTTIKTPQWPKNPQYPFFPFYPYPPVPVTTAAPTTTTKPHWPKHPQYPPFFPFYPFPPFPVTPAPTTTTKPHWPKHPHYPPFFPFYPFPPFPVTPAPTTTTKPHWPKHPHYPPFFPFYPFPPFPVTPAPTTTTKPHRPKHPHYPPFFPYHPYPFPVTMVAPTTTTKPHWPKHPHYLLSQSHQRQLQPKHLH